MLTKSKLSVFRQEFPWLDQAVARCQVYKFGEWRLKDAKVSRVDEGFVASIPKRPFNPTREIGLRAYNGELLAEVHFLDKEGRLLGRYNLETTPVFRTKPFRWLHPSTWFAFDSEPMSEGQKPSWWGHAEHVGVAPSIGEWILNHKLEDVHFVVWFRVCPGGIEATIYKPPKGMSIIGLARVVRGVLRQKKEAELEALRQEIIS